MGNLARMSTPNFVSGPDSSALVTDVYRANNQDNYNYNQSSNVTKSSPMDIVAGTLSQVALKTVLDKAGLQQPNLLMGNIQTPLYGIIGNNSSLSNLSRDLTPGMNSMLGGIQLPSLPVNMNVGGVNSVIPSYGVKDAGVLSGLIGSIGGNRSLSNVFNPNDLMGSVSGAVNMGSSLGVKNILPSIMPGITNALSGSGLGNTSSMLMGVVQNSLPSLVKGGDFNSLKSLPGFAPPGMANATMPNFNSDVFSNYKKKEPTFPPGQEVLYGDEDEFEDADAAIDAVNQNDNEWNKLKRQNVQGQPETVTDISDLYKASPEMKEAIKRKARESIITEEKNYALMDAFPKQSIQSQFGGSSIDSLTNSVNNVSNLIDPNLNEVVIYN